MKQLLVILAFFIIPLLGATQNQYVDDVISIIQNDTTYQSIGFAYEYELENGEIKHPDSLIYHLDYQLLERIPDKWPNQIVFYTDTWTCTQVMLPNGQLIDKHLVIYDPSHGEYEICFYVVEISQDLIEINYIVRTGRHWW